MSDDKPIGAIEWRDLTVDNAEQVSDFYQRVVGWTKTPVAMGDYDDFNMLQPSSGEVTAGVCHARGDNADLPPQWMMYVRVQDVQKSVAEVGALGGKVLKGPSRYAGDTYYVIQDPAGAVMTIFSASE